MYFPWCGLLNQIMFSDFFVHYDDVQFARGFFNRVQVKTMHGMKWLTVPLIKKHRDQKINECVIDYSNDWRKKHRDILRNTYFKAPYVKNMLELFDSVVSKKHTNLNELSKHSILALVSAFGIAIPQYIDSSDLEIKGKSSQRLFDITKALNGDIYISGHGGLNYIDQSLFSSGNVALKTLKYKFLPWEQPYGTFTPYVSGLECFAYLGESAKDYLKSSLLDWEEALIMKKNDTLLE